MFYDWQFTSARTDSFICGSVSTGLGPCQTSPEISVSDCRKFPWALMNKVHILQSVINVHILLQGMIKVQRVSFQGKNLFHSCYNTNPLSVQTLSRSSEWTITPAFGAGYYLIPVPSLFQSLSNSLACRSYIWHLLAHICLESANGSVLVLLAALSHLAFLLLSRYIIFSMDKCGSKAEVLVYLS